jgi:hypothetical protein
VTWTRPSRWIAAATVIVLAQACSGGPGRVSLSPPSGKISHEDYDKFRGRWTRGTKIIKQLDTTLHLHATLFAPEFSAAYVARRTHTFKLPADKRAELSARLRKEWSESYPFFLAAATMDYDWNNFDRKDPTWSLSLINDKGEQVSPVEVKVEREITPIIVDLFPFVGRFHRVYWVRFPKTLPDGRPLLRDEIRRLSIRCAGPLGRAELVWQVR